MREAPDSSAPLRSVASTLTPRYCAGEGAGAPFSNMIAPRLDRLACSPVDAAPVDASRAGAADFFSEARVEADMDWLFREKGIAAGAVVAGDTLADWLAPEVASRTGVGFLWRGGTRVICEDVEFTVCAGAGVGSFHIS